MCTCTIRQDERQEVDLSAHQSLIYIYKVLNVHKDESDETQMYSIEVVTRGGDEDKANI